MQKKFFSLDKIIDLVLKCNNDDVKIFESFYKLCIELQKSSDEINKQISNYALNKYSKNVNNYISESFCDYIIEKFKGMFIQKRPNNIVYDENAYFVINTISNIYNNDKIENKNKLDYINETINDFCERKLIIGVIDYLFQSIERNECDIINIMSKDYQQSIRLIKRIKLFINSGVNLVKSILNTDSIKILLDNTCNILECEKVFLFI